MRILVRTLVGVLLAWLAGANVVLNLDASRGLFSPKPERFEVRWDLAFSPFPGVVWARGVEVHVATERVITWLAADRALAVFEPWALARATLRTRLIRVSGVEARTRPQPGIGGIWNRLQAHLPAIPGRPALEHDAIGDGALPVGVPVADPDRPPSRWRLEFNGIRADHIRSARLHALDLAFEGTLHASVHVRIRDTVAVPGIRADGLLLDVQLSGEPVAERIAIEGRATIAPYVPREHRGHRMLRFTSGDAALEGDFQSLRAINFYFGPDSDLRVDGRGRAAVQLRLVDGAVEPGSRARLDDAVLDARWHGWRVAGGGDIEVVAEETDDDRQLTATVEGATLSRLDDDAILVESGRLHAVQVASRLPLTERTGDERVNVRMEDGRIPDISVLHRYLPAELGVTFEPDGADIALQWEIDPGAIHARAGLDANGLTLSLDGHGIRTDGVADLRLVIDRGSGRVDASGTVVRIANAQVLETDADDPFHARLEVVGGQVQPRRNAETPAAFASGRVVLGGEVSDIGFLDVLVPGPQALGWRGPAGFSADLHVDDGRLLAGSTVRLAAPNLSVRFLDFVAGGSGEIVGWLEGDTTGGRFGLSGALNGVEIARIGERNPHVEAARLDVSASGRATRLTRALDDVEVHVDLPVATVSDIRVYDRYLPEAAGVELVGGTARLSMRLKLTEDDGQGQIGFDAPDARIRVHENTVSGRISADIRLSRGRVADRLFDLDGSRIVLTDVAVNDGDGQWWAEANVTEGRVRWSEPIHVDARVDTRLRDSGPLVHLFLDDRLRFDWMRRVLDTPDIAGHTAVGIDPGGIVFNNADVRSADFDVSAHLRFAREQPPQGMLLIGHGRFAVAVELRDGERDWSLRQARQRFADYPAFPMPSLR